MMGLCVDDFVEFFNNRSLASLGMTPLWMDDVVELSTTDPSLRSG
jgi:hypothetical protein